MRTQQPRRDRVCLAKATSKLSSIPLLAALILGPAVVCSAGDFGWSYPAGDALRVHVVRGSSYYTRNYRVDAILARAGVNLVTESTQGDRGVAQWGDTSTPDAGWLRGYADPAGAVMDHHLVVVSSVGASEFGNNSQVLVDFVRHGGSVLFVCGSNTFGDRSARSIFAEMAPLEFPAEGPWTLETESASESLALAPGPDYQTQQLPNTTPDKPPCLYSYYQIKPKPGAKVLLVAGEDKPLLIVGEFGKGRVGVFAATCRGYSKEGQLPYWEWSGWPGFMAATIQRLAATAGNAPHGLGEDGRRAIIEAMNQAYDLLDGVNEAGRGQFEAALGAAAARCHDTPTAEFLLGLLARYPLDLTNEMANALGPSLAPWVDASCTEHARTLIDSGQPGKTLLGLIVLGSAGPEDAAPALTAFHQSGQPRQRSESGADLPSVEAVMRAEENAVLIRRAAVAGLGLLGDTAALPLLKTAATAHADKGRFSPDDDPDVIEPAHRDYQNAMLAALLCGDAEAAGPVVDFLLGNVAVISRAATEQGQRQSALKWQQQLHHCLAMAPDRVVPALAMRIAAERSSNVATTALAALGGKELSPELAKLLSESENAVVAELGKRQLQQ